jgi:hypothetical protein
MSDINPFAIAAAIAIGFVVAVPFVALMEAMR